MTQGIKYFETSYAITQLSSNSSRYAEERLAIGSLLVAGVTLTNHILVMNLSDARRTLCEETRRGDVFPVTSLKIDGTLDTLCGSQYFSVLGLYSGF